MSSKRGWQLVPHAVRDNISLSQYGARINQGGRNGLQCVLAGDTAVGAPSATTRVVNEEITIVGMAELGMTQKMSRDIEKGTKNGGKEN